MRLISVMILIMISGSILFSSEIDYSGGEYDFSPVGNEMMEVVLPDNFDINIANAQLHTARENEDMETANLLALQINQYWKQNRTMEYDPLDQGSSVNSPQPEIINLNENQKLPKDYAPLWGDDVRIDPRDDMRDGNVVSLSNGDLYCVAIYHPPSGDYTIVTNRSTDDGQTWSVCHEYTASGYNFLEPRLSVADDTLIQSYIIINPSNEFRAWVRVFEPGASLNSIYFGSPTQTGSFQDNPISDLRITNDGPTFTDKYIYATWTESNLTGTDSTWVMFARSSDMDVNSWNIHDTLRISDGNGIFYDDTRIANGMGDDLLVAAHLHPNNYPYYDELIRGWTSTNGGSSWSSYFNLTPSDNDLDESQPAIAGAHNNINWVCIVTQEDTVPISDKNLINYYSTDNGANWTEAGWVYPDSNYLAYVMVDYNSTAFYAVFRKDLANGDEEVKFKQGNITNPNSWTQSVTVNDDVDNLSGVYGPSVCYNYSADGVCVLWNDYQSSIYSLWFDNMSWTTGVEEEPVTSDINPELFSVIHNGRSFRISYSVTSPGPVSIKIFDLSGRNVANVLNEVKEIGTYSVNYEPDFSSGSYFFTIQTQEGIQTKPTFFVK
ncbi:MAG: T9SS type A sorting domain-containing protein [bacterium]